MFLRFELNPNRYRLERWRGEQGGNVCERYRRTQRKKFRCRARRIALRQPTAV